MKRFTLALTVATVGLGLGACASDPETLTPATPQPQATQAPGGEWVVVDDYAAESVAALKSPYLGQPVVLDAARAVDAAGRLCKTPQYWESTAPADAALGHPAQPQAAHAPEPRRTIAITCDGAAFATLVAQPDGTWLTRQNAWVLKLDKPAAKPVALTAAPEAAPAPAPEPAAAEPAKAAPKQDPRTLVYLASYKTEAQALSGFKTLGKASPILAKQQPTTRAVDLGKKGKWVRLYGLAANEAERATLCKQLGKQVDECGARNRE
ncbi:MAG: hypothetical protein ACM31D_10145 [Bacteroidota bacterium]